MILIWIAVSFFSGVFFGVFVMALARMAATETPQPSRRHRVDEAQVAGPIPGIRRAG